MKQWKIFITFAAMLVVASAYANLDAPDITVDAALRQGTSVVFGQFTGHSSTDLWEYEGIFDDTGKPTHHTEVITIYDFRVDEIIDGQSVAAQIKINVPGGVKNQFKTPSKVQMPSAGRPVALSIIEDRGARSRGRSGYNMVHAKYEPIDSPTQLTQLRKHARMLRAQPPISPDAIIERDLEGVDLGTRVVANAGNHEQDRPNVEKNNNSAPPGNIRQGEKIPQQRVQVPMSSLASKDTLIARAEIGDNQTGDNLRVNKVPMITPKSEGATNIEVLGITPLASRELAAPLTPTAIESHWWIILVGITLLVLGGLILGRKTHVRPLDSVSKQKLKY